MGEKDNENDCCICLQPKKRVINKSQIFVVKEKQLYFECKCLLRCHKRCLIEWLRTTPKCIICRKVLSEYVHPAKKVLRFCTNGRVIRMVIFLYVILYLCVKIREEDQKKIMH